MFSVFIKVFILTVTAFEQLLYGVILGIVQGISEWLPISSKTQVLIVSTYLFNLSFSDAYAFGLFMEIGTILAAVIYFRKELWSLIQVLARQGDKESKTLFKYVLVCTVFTGIVAAPLFLYIDSISGTYNIGVPMLIMGIILILDALIIKYSRSKYGIDSNRKTLDQMSLKDYVLVGIAQGIAALPGVSRSGVTTSSLLLLNVEVKEAFRLSFIAMIFATSGAVALTYIATRASIMATIAQLGLGGLIVAIIVATIVSLLLIDFLLDIARKSSVVYLTAALGIIALVSGTFAALYGIA